MRLLVLCCMSFGFIQGCVTEPINSYKKYDNGTTISVSSGQFRSFHPTRGEEYSVPDSQVVLGYPRPTTGERFGTFLGDAVTQGMADITYKNGKFVHEPGVGLYTYIDETPRAPSGLPVRNLSIKFDDIVQSVLADKEAVRSKRFILANKNSPSAITITPDVRFIKQKSGASIEFRYSVKHVNVVTGREDSKLYVYPVPEVRDFFGGNGWIDENFIEIKKHASLAYSKLADAILMDIDEETLPPNRRENWMVVEWRLPGIEEYYNRDFLLKEGDDYIIASALNYNQPILKQRYVLNKRFIDIRRPMQNYSDLF